jgi:hypothetical protein
MLPDYMGGIIDHSSNLPDHVALTAAEAQYNQAYLAIMAAIHTTRKLEDLHKQESQHLTLLIMDSYSGIAIGASLMDTKHNRHIL